MTRVRTTASDCPPSSRWSRPRAARILVGVAAAPHGQSLVRLATLAHRLRRWPRAASSSRRWWSDPTRSRTVCHVQAVTFLTSGREPAPLTRSSHDGPDGLPATADSGRSRRPRCESEVLHPGRTGRRTWFASWPTRPSWPWPHRGRSSARRPTRRRRTGFGRRRACAGRCREDRRRDDALTLAPMIVATRQLDQTRATILRVEPREFGPTTRDSRITVPAFVNSIVASGERHPRSSSRASRDPLAFRAPSSRGRAIPPGHPAIERMYPAGSVSKQLP